MALLDEDKLQGRIYDILDILRKDINCCKVVSSTWASSSLIGAGVFVTVDQNGGIKVYDAPGGTQLSSVEYGVLTKP